MKSLEIKNLIRFSVFFFAFPLSCFMLLNPVKADGTTPINPLEKIELGTSHSCRVDTLGAAQCWGLNTNGQLGDNSTTMKLVPTQVSGLASGVQAITAGATHSCALLTSGSVQCWGNNSFGQIGDNTSGTDRLVPTQVTGLTSGVQAITVGDYYSCALLTSGAVQCWGRNSYGQIGDNSITTRLVPTQVNGLVSGVTAIAVGGGHSCALLSNGSVQCWGYNYYGQVGDNTSGNGTNRLVPTQVTGLTSGVQAITTGATHTCAILGSGAMQCWGRNTNGQIGDNTSGIDRIVPTQVTGLTSGVEAIAGGAKYSCALLATGSVKCWGYNNYGQLGDNVSDGILADILIPTQVSGLNSGVQAIATGGSHSCAVLDNSSVQCWGYNYTGQIGDNTSGGFKLLPTQVISLTSGVTAISSGDAYSCALLNTGAVQCWGSNSDGVIGDGSFGTYRLVPTQVTGLTSGVQAIAAGDRHVCALLNTGAVQCWGYNPYGQIGDNTSGNYRLVPTQVSGLTSGVTAITAGEYMTCAILNTGAVQCWGYNANGSVGDNTLINKLVPTQVTGLTSGVQAIDSGSGHTCAILSTGAVQCWGNNSLGQIGDGTSGGGTNKKVPTQVTGLTSGVLAIDAGANHSCAIISTGAVQCWGYNANGQLGDNSVTMRKVPTQVSGLTSGVSKISLGDTHSCAILSSGAVQCWGGNGSGQIGDNTSGTNRLVPTQVSGLTSGILQVDAGAYYNCALLSSGAVQCWGADDYGQLGDNTVFKRAAIEIVAGSSSGFIILGGTIPANTHIALLSDDNIDPTTTAQTGIQNIRITNATTNRPITEFPLDFSGDLDLSDLTIDSSETSTLVHVSGGIDNLLGVPLNSTYTMYVPKNSGDQVRICPNAATLSLVTLSCDNGYTLGNGGSNGGVTVSISGLNWKIEGLTGTGAMSVLTGVIQDAMTRLAVATKSDHFITFGTNYGVALNSTFTIEFDPSVHDFDFTGLTITDIDLTDTLSTVYPIASSATATDWGLTLTSDTLTFTAPSTSGNLLGASQVIVLIGTNAGGSNQITNPVTAASYKLVITLNGVNPERGEITVPIVDSDQIDVTGYINTFINFDIDTAVAELDCGFDDCKYFGDAGAVAGNYTVDLGELNSISVNKSNSGSVTHTAGSGVINSIYFDLTTNAGNGAIVTVTSVNGGLESAGITNNRIETVTDGQNIIANSGSYGYQMPLGSSGNGTILTNAACTETLYCALTTGQSTVFTTNSLPLDNGRVRMDIAAAAAYTNNPGNYIDTLTFVAIPTY